MSEAIAGIAIGVAFLVIAAFIGWPARGFLQAAIFGVGFITFAAMNLSSKK